MRVLCLVKNQTHFAPLPRYTWQEKSRTIEVEEDEEQPGTLATPRAVAAPPSSSRMAVDAVPRPSSSVAAPLATTPSLVCRVESSMIPNTYCDDGSAHWPLTQLRGVARRDQETATCLDICWTPLRRSWGRTLSKGEWEERIWLGVAARGPYSSVSSR